ncbi:sulfurtransferase complex subunit TusB [Methylocaldum sp. RMAD-M]|jgi:tRNA 2-thiouridine synthesizing protein B|uniref:sulfurtransferase complex subunit TusB n=1 Tax=Methylocaldum sp. RMAD-M TaxID=2806557 RepID=UPI000A3295AE|nr:sulfurtransferase complex subunit TusB [Methylocaldum sp. RMAD-M]MBP1149023.1 tRNA 2-thiouridine synthesizing protein B [Methylocaldum sp. RMAD-M]MVF20221.1 sulfurtransferase complex subunit TusB [Methylocaldum sp. BRCS4]
MAVLHLVNRSPQESRALEDCLARAGKGDAVLLIENAVYAAVKGGDSEAVLKSAMGRVRFYALGPDLDARGVETSEVAETIRIVDYGGFVDLTVESRLVQSWF